VENKVVFSRGEGREGEPAEEGENVLVEPRGGTREGGGGGGGREGGRALRYLGLAQGNDTEGGMER